MLADYLHENIVNARIAARTDFKCQKRASSFQFKPTVDSSKHNARVFRTLSSRRTVNIIFQSDFPLLRRGSDYTQSTSNKERSRINITKGAKQQKVRLAENRCKAKSVWVAAADLLINSCKPQYPSQITVFRGLQSRKNPQLAATGQGSCIITAVHERLK